MIVQGSSRINFRKLEFKYRESTVSLIVSAPKLLQIHSGNMDAHRAIEGASKLRRDTLNLCEINLKTATRSTSSTPHEDVLAIDTMI